MAASPRRALDLRTFDQLIADVDRLRVNGYEKTGDWSLEQTLDHLTKAMILAMGGKGLPRLVKWLLKPVVARLLRTRSMPRMPAPKSLRPPPEPAVVDAGVHARFAAAVAQAAGLEGDTVDHPAFGRMNVQDWQQLQLIHASRHLSFLVPRRA